MLTAETQKQQARIKYELACQGYSQVDVASECAVEPGTVSAVIHGRSRSKKIEMRIAAITRLPLAELWPQWHGAQAQSRRRRSLSHTQISDALRAAAG